MCNIVKPVYTKQTIYAGYIRLFAIRLLLRFERDPISFFTMILFQLEKLSFSAQIQVVLRIIFLCLFIFVRFILPVCAGQD